MIRAHDLAAKGENNIVKRLDELGLDGVQLVAYKSIDGVAYAKGSLSKERAKEIGDAVGKSLRKQLGGGCHQLCVARIRYKSKLDEDRRHPRAAQYV